MTIELSREMAQSRSQSRNRRKPIVPNAAEVIVPVVPKEKLLPLSVKFPTDVIRRLDEVSEDTGNNRSAVILYLVRWGLEQYEAQKAKGR